MSTARRLIPHFVSFGALASLLSVALLAGPAAARGDLEFRVPGQPLHPILGGGIVDDNGPFFRIDWGSPTLVNQWALPPEQEKQANPAGAEPSIRFNSATGRAIAFWIVPATPARVAERDRSGGLFVSQFTVGGWTEPFEIATAATNPSLSVDDRDGSIHLVYAAADQIHYRAASADLANWTLPVIVSSSDERATRPTVAVQQRRISIAYESRIAEAEAGPSLVVMAQVPRDTGLSSEGPTITRVILGTDRYTGDHKVRIDAEGDNGRLLVRWVADDGLFGWTIQSDGVWSPVRFERLFERPDRAGERSNKR